MSRFMFGMFVVFFLFVGCTNNVKPKVGFLIHQIDNRWEMDVKYLTEYFESEGIDLIIKNAKGDENLQLKQAEELIDENVNLVLIVSVNQNTAAGIVRHAHDNSTPVIAYDRIIKNSNVDYLLSFEYEEIGGLLIEYSMSKHPKGNYVLLWGDSDDNNARIMQKSEMNVIQPFVDNGDINIVYRGYVDGWNYDNAFFLMKRIVDFSEKGIVDVVIANNDVIAKAVIDAWGDYGFDKDILITGQDATLQACRMIAQGKQDMTIYKPISDLAKTAVDISKKIIYNQDVKTNGSVYNGRIDIPSVLLSPIVVDKNNLRSVVIDSGLYDEDEVFQ